MKYDFDEDDKVLNKILIGVLEFLVIIIIVLAIMILSAAFLPGGA
jgi:hypothetical protein